MIQNSSIARRLASQMWGEVQSQQKLAPGIWLFDTAGHGGYVVDTNIRQELKGCETIVCTRSGGCKYRPDEQHFAQFEEDCEASKVEWLFPDMFRKLSTNYDMQGLSLDQWIAQRREYLRSSLNRWNPEFLEKHPNPTK